MNNIWILADAQEGENREGTEVGSEPVGENDVSEEKTTEVVGDNGGKAPAGEGEAPPPSPWIRFAPLIILMIFMYFILLRGPKKKQEKHNNLVKSIKKNDRIQTIGGIIGTVIEVRDKEIIIKIDESSNTRMRITKGAVGSVLTEES